MISEAVLEKLEFPKILQQISKYSSTEPGKKILLGLKPFESLYLAIQEGDYVTEAKEILIKNDFPPINYIPELADSLSLSAIDGSVLDSKAILEILKLAETSRYLFLFLKSNAEGKSISKDFLNDLFVDKVLEHHITKVINENGEVKENASSKLKEIREEVRRKSETLQKVINRILKSLSDAYLVREEYVTQRDGRIVVPVKAEHKRHVKGFIHSESATGQTVYIEPEETLELNNDILSLYFAEKREIERILRELTKKIGEYVLPLKKSLSAIADLDSIFARAKYSIEIIGSFPSIDNSKPIKIMEARHPLLIKKIGRSNAVPLDLSIENGTNIILITGPNAGGKTVVLKTVGLLSIMVLSGIHIPAQADSNLHFLENILMDIGDQQSIEDDLSTFSSHLSNIRKIIYEAVENSIILLDEIGTGTDPAEGSALAIAILLTLQNKKSKVLATTHHGSLKLMAEELEGFQNASMEFDSDNLIPTYKFRQGVPGSSYAFEVAERIGFTKDFLSLAKNYLDSDKMKVEEFLVELETRSRNLQTKLNEYEVENSRLKGLTNLYKQNLEKLETQKKDILIDTKTKAESFIKDVNKKVENAIKQIRESQANREVIKDVRKQISDLKKDVEKVAEVKIQNVAKMEFAIGSFAKLRTSELSGKIIEIDFEKNKAVLVTGTVKLQVKLDEIIPISGKEAKSQERFQSSFHQTEAEVRIDIRGQKPEEAEFEVIKFLDNAYTSGLNRVEILHGKGTGVLKKMTKDILSEHPGVSKFYFANIEYGGDGITIVELK
ncbi:MAG: endonuclease MutS2 [Ignavibacteriales bacterium]|nr:endonuclease MutS2 [Ignavibacteriales bacterium]